MLKKHNYAQSDVREGGEGGGGGWLLHKVQIYI